MNQYTGFLLKLLSALVFLVFFSFSLQAKTIKYAPLPMYKSELVLKQYQAMLNYLQKETKLNYEYVYYADYEKLLNAIAEGKVDIAHLGPLPYATLLQRKDHNSKPLVQLLDSKQKGTYTCSFFTHERNKNKQIFEPIALTQPLSTCGFLSVAHLLKSRSLDLSKLNYHYSGTHSHVVLDVILNDAKSGGVKTSEYLSYKHLGLYEIDKTDPFPGFLLVASKSLRQTEYEAIKHALLKLDPFNNPNDKELMKKWGTNVKYGAIEVDVSLYRHITKMLKQIKIPETQ